CPWDRALGIVPASSLECLRWARWPTGWGVAVLGRSPREGPDPHQRRADYPRVWALPQGPAMAIRVVVASRQGPYAGLEPAQGLLKLRPPSSVDKQRTIALRPPVRGRAEAKGARYAFGRKVCGCFGVCGNRPREF